MCLEFFSKTADGFALIPLSFQGEGTALLSSPSPFKERG
jgi:hypothetical protein